MERDTKPTFCFQPLSTTTDRRRPPIEPVVLVILLLLLIFYFLPPPHIPKTIKPTPLKFTWITVITVLVFFAILCGVFDCGNNDMPMAADATIPVNGFLLPESSEYREKVQANRDFRSITSYPDWRQVSVWENRENRLRFSSDFGLDLQYSSPVNNRPRRREGEKESLYRSEKVIGVYNNRSRRREGRNESLYRSEKVSGDIHHHSRRGEGGKESLHQYEKASGDIRHRPRRSEAEKVHSRVKGSMVEPPNVPESMVDPPAPAPPISVKLRRRPTSGSLGRDKTFKVTSRIDEGHGVFDTPQPPPPLPPAKSEHPLYLKHSKLDREIGEVTTGTTITSLDARRKKKQKPRQKSRNIPPPTQSIQLPLPPPPTSPPSLFKKETKHKKVHSVPWSLFRSLIKSGGKSKSKRFHPSKPSQPPPPPPIIDMPLSSPKRIATVTLKQEPKHKSQIKSSSPKLKPLHRRSARTDKPPLPRKTSNNYDCDDFLASGSQSPLIPAPPPPPFKMPAMKFELRGHLVRLLSPHGSDCSSPDREATKVDGRDSFGPSPKSSPGPDVNTKADSFISKRKFEWRNEKLNSVKKKVGPTSSTSPK